MRWKTPLTGSLAPVSGETSLGFMKMERWRFSGRRSMRDCTKKQLRILIFFETALLGFPAAVLGSITGVLGTWCLVKVLLRQKNAVFVLDIPVVSLVLFFTLWIIALAGMRILVLQMALKQPLTGRFEIQQVKKQKVNRMKGVLLAGLSVSMAGIVIFVCMEAFPIFYKREINEKSRSYSINALENPFV